MVDEVVLARFRREIIRAVKTPERAQELLLLLSSTSWLEVGRIDYETRKVNCDGCSRPKLYKLMIHKGKDSQGKDQYYCSDCDESVKKGFPCECNECEQDFICYSHSFYRSPDAAPIFRGWVRCPACQAKREESLLARNCCLICHGSYHHDWVQEPLICPFCKDIYGIDERSIRKEYQKVHSHQQRAVSLNLPATLTLNQWFVTLVRFDWLCAYCLTLPYENFDHFVPLCKGGGTTPDNCVPACLSCNSIKGQRHPNNVTGIAQSDFQRVAAYLQQFK